MIEDSPCVSASN